MKKLLIGILAIGIVATATLFIVRQLQGWNDGMQNARSEIHATVLQGKIYVAGGIGLFRVLDSCESYDLTDKVWQSCPPLPRPLHHVAMAADTTNLYASGGYIALPFEQDEDANLFSLNPQNATWIELAKLPHPIGQHAMLHKDGKLYLVGGQNGAEDLASLWSFDLATKQWTALPPMPTARHSHAIATSGDTLYVSGGRSAALGTEINIVEGYSFSDDSWESLPAMPTGRGGHGAFVRDGKLHVFGGESLSQRKVLASHEILDLQSGIWSTGEDMEQPRHGFAVGDDGTIGSPIIIGGGAHPGIQTIYSVTGTTQSLNY